MAVNLIRRGDIILTNLSPGRPGEADKIHPAIVVTNNIANLKAPLIVVVPITSNLEKVFPFELELPNNHTGLNKDSKAQVNLIRHVHLNRLIKTLGYMPEDLMLELDARIREHLAL